jgi:hypothetical protein
MHPFVPGDIPAIVTWHSATHFWESNIFLDLILTSSCFFLSTAAVSCGVTHEGEVFLDPSKQEEQVCQLLFYLIIFFPLLNTSLIGTSLINSVEYFNLWLFPHWTISCEFQRSKAHVCLVFPSRPLSAVPELPLDVDGEPVQHGVVTCVTRGAMEGKGCYFCWVTYCWFWMWTPHSTVKNMRFHERVRHEETDYLMSFPYSKHLSECVIMFS